MGKTGRLESFGGLARTRVGFDDLKASLPELGGHHGLAIRAEGEFLPLARQHPELLAGGHVEVRKGVLARPATGAGL